MIAQYDKVIVISKDEHKKYVVIQDEKTHTPTLYSLTKCGMDDYIQMVNDDHVFHFDQSKIDPKDLANIEPGSVIQIKEK